MNAVNLTFEQKLQGVILAVVGLAVAVNYYFF